MLVFGFRKVDFRDAIRIATEETIWSGKVSRNIGEKSGDRPVKTHPGKHAKKRMNRNRFALSYARCLPRVPLEKRGLQIFKNRGSCESADPEGKGGKGLILIKRCRKATS